MPLPLSMGPLVRNSQFQQTFSAKQQWSQLKDQVLMRPWGFISLTACCQRAAQLLLRVVAVPIKKALAMPHIGSLQIHRLMEKVWSSHIDQVVASQKNFWSQRRLANLIAPKSNAQSQFAQIIYMKVTVPTISSSQLPLKIARLNQTTRRSNVCIP